MTRFYAGHHHPHWDDATTLQRQHLLVQLSLGSSPPTTLSGSGTTAGSQLGSPTSLPEAFTAPSSGGEGSSGGSPSDGVTGGNAALAQLSTKCSLCHDTFTIPKVLNCLHTFCQPCLEKECTGDKVRCPQCNHDTPLPPGGTAGLPSDYAVSNILETAALEGASLGCTGCKGKESSAVARCFDCANFLCPNCVMAHQFMHCFEGHRVLTLGELQSARDGLRAPQDKPVACLRHRSEALRYFCRSCDTPVCKECALLDHPKAMHDLEPLSEAAPRHVEGLSHMVEDGRVKSHDLRAALKTLEQVSSRLQAQYQRAQGEVADTFHFYRSMLEERRQETLRELENVYNAKMVSLGLLGQKVQDTIERIHQVCAFVERLTRFSTSTEALVFKQLLEAKFQGFLSFRPEAGLHGMDLEFVSNYQAIQVGVRNTFGYIKQGGAPEGAPRQPPIARPNGVVLGPAERSSTLHQNGHHPPPPPTSPFESNLLSKRFSSANSLGPFSTSLADVSPYEKWSSGGADIFHNGSDFGAPQDAPAAPPQNALAELSSKYLAGTGVGLYPLKSQIKRQKMIYHCKFGEFGVMEGQFTEPSGVAVNAQNDIVVADTNNHRIQIFDREGRFKFQFGECGKRDGQLLYPNRVAVVRQSGDIVVTERSPTHQIQIYNQYGQFVRKFGAVILQHPRGVAVDPKGRVVVVECKVMRVIIFDQSGNVLQKFGCSKHLEFPNGVVVNDRQEIFISDNRAHCVKVFNYDGVFLRQIGGEGLTNYPIGVCMNQGGEILVADNHNNFNVTVFTQDGQLVNALESKVKHAQCFDVALMDDGSVVLASKDYRLYVYRYVQLPASSSAPPGSGGGGGGGSGGCL
ncbi:tripartite motif-containing protein brain tumor isoform X1 [Dermacentor variabilis]|uniref:tripartite motif-containing protein brain tumor isoform X1 n=1 Tax=Dermacentor variabilis TaxID=34621 RepID=UPI003F5BBDDF